MNQHRKIQKKIAERKGKIEVSISRKRRLDVKKERQAIEIERSGNPVRIVQALSRLKAQRNFKKILLVPHKDLDKAKEIAKRKNINVVIQNLSRTSRRIVKR